MSLVPALEALIHAAGRPLTLEAMARFFQQEEHPPSLETLKESMEQLQAQYAGHGIELVEVASGYRFQTRPDLYRFVLQLFEEKPSRYSRALMETLALIAYRQPITRSEIEEIRGVNVSPSILKTLLDHEWVRVIGHREVPGRPALYATTHHFLEHLGLKSLEQLPPLAPKKDLETLTKTVEKILEA